MMDDPTHIMDLLSEEEKNNKDYLIAMTDLSIAELVKEKTDIQKAFNYYDGVLDKEQSQHLEDLYGLNSSTSLEFIPLVKPHVDQLVGELLQIPFKPKITCKDKKTLSNINREKQLSIAKGLFEETKKHINNIFVEQLNTEEDQQSKQDPFIVNKLEQLKEELTQGFVSEYEISAQYLLEYFKQTRSLNLLDRRKQLFKDLTIAGQCYFNTSFDKEGSLPELERIHPLHCFPELNPNSVFVNKSSRVVIRRFMTKQEILVKYGHLMKDDDIQQLEYGITPSIKNDNYYITTEGQGIIAGISPTTMGDPTTNITSSYRNRYTVYEVQWLSANKYEKNGETKYRMDRYRTVRINDSIHILYGKDENVYRDQNYPDDCTLSVNGVIYEDSKGKPYSLVLATANLQDKYNILHFYRDNFIALSGVKGSAVESSIIPEWLGTTPEERFQKFIAYKKQGNAPLDSSQEGQTDLNTALFLPYDDSLDGNALQQLQLAIQSIEEICSRITGVFREKLGGVEQKDAVTNVQVGIRQSTIITKQYYQVMDSMTKELLHDLINGCRISFKKGFTGSIVLGDNLIKIFEIKPENFNYTDYDIHIDDSGDIVRDMQKIEQLTLELVKAGQQDVDIILSSVGMHSLTQMKFEVQQSINKKKKEVDQINNLTNQLNQAQQQLQQLNQQLSKLQQENATLLKKDRELEKYKIDKDFEIRKYGIDVQRKTDSIELELDKKRVDLEQMQLYDNNPQNNEIRND